MITVAEAAKRLGKSHAQVRRRLRKGTLKGQRVGNQWFVEEAHINRPPGKRQPLIPRELIEEVKETRRRIAEENPGYVFDVLAMIREVRGGP